MKNLLRSFLGVLLIILEASILATPIITVALLCSICWQLIFLEVILMPAAYVLIAFGTKYQWKVFTYPLELMMGDEE